MLVGAMIFATVEPAAGTCAGPKQSADGPFDDKEDDKRQNENNHQTGNAGFNIVIVGLNQHITLMTGDKRTEYNAREQQDEQQ